MKIGIDARFLDSNNKTGVEIYLTNLVNNLAIIDKDNEYLLYFNSLRRRESSFCYPKQENFKARAIKLPAFNLNCFNEIWATLISKFMSKDKVEIAHLMPSAFPKSAIFKTIATIHDLGNYMHQNLQSDNGRRALFLKKILTRTINNADQLIAVSENTKNDLIAFFPSAAYKINVIHHGTNFKKEPVSPQEIEKFKKKYNLGENNILFIGSIEKRKNIETLLKAFSKLLNQPNFSHKLILVGKNGSASELITKTIKCLRIQSSVVLTGYVPTEHIPYFYYTSDVLVFPSFYEGFGLPIIEAMNCEAPVIMSNIPVFREVAGDAGIYFEPDNPDELCSSIQELITDKNLRKKIINKGIERAKRYSWKNTARETLLLYEKLKYS